MSMTVRELYNDSGEPVQRQFIVEADANTELQVIMDCVGVECWKPFDEEHTDFLCSRITVTAGELEGVFNVECSYRREVAMAGEGI